MSKKLTPWIVDPDADHCYMRCIEGTDINDIANRVAFIEKTPRIRIHAYTNDDWLNWMQGYKGDSTYGLNQESRNWCDKFLIQLGYELS